MLQTARQRFYYILADFISANCAWFVFNIIRFLTLPYNYETMSLGTYLSMGPVIWGQCLFPVMMVTLYAISGYYNHVFFKSRLNDALNAMGMALIGTLIIFFAVLFNDKIDDRLGNFEMILILWCLFSIFTTIPRLIITSVATKRIWRREIAFNTLIVGTSPEALALAADFEERHRSMGFRVLGFVNAGTPGRKASSPLPTFDISDIEEEAKRLNIQSFVIVPGDESSQQTIQTINTLLPLGQAVYLTPDNYHIVSARPRTAMVAGQVLIDVSQANIPSSTVNLKRLGDIFCSSIALIVLSPLFAVLAYLIKKDSPGPVIYKQERIGYKKRPFNIYKFRSMRTDAEADGPALSSTHDPRITKVGRVLRKYRLDELPQFWNVLRGDMSLVGPRPERAYYLDQIIKRAPHYNLVHQVRPGITSWGMVKYGYASNVDEMIERLKYDLLYVENVSFVVDMKILFYTVSTVVTGKGI